MWSIVLSVSNDTYSPASYFVIVISLKLYVPDFANCNPGKFVNLIWQLLSNFAMGILMTCEPRD